MKIRDIIQVSAYYPPHLGGQEYVVRDLASQLAHAGHHVQVVTSTEGGSAPGTRLEDGVLVRRLPGLVFGHAPIMPLFPAKLFRVANKKTVVHLHIGQAFTPEMVWLVSKLRRFKYIAELHIDFEPSSAAGVLLPFYKKVILGRVLRSAESVITLNKETLRTVREVYGCEDRISIMHNGIDDRYYTIERPRLGSKPPQTLRLLFVGRLSKQKNLHALLEALSLTKRAVHLDILGDGDERDTIKKLIDAYGLTNVTMHGRKERDEVIEFYKTCDCLIMPSLYEAQPLVLLEAMAAGVPIIGTDVIGVGDNIVNVGIVVQPTVQGLIEGIEQYFAQYLLLQAMTDRGRVVADRYRWRNTLKDYERLYETVAGN